MVAAQLKWST